MFDVARIGDPAHPGSWRADPVHRAFLRASAWRQLDFFRASLTPAGRFAALDRDGAPIPGAPQELHVTARLVHAYALAKAFGYAGADAMIDAGMAALWHLHRDSEFGGYVWSVDADGIRDGVKLAYGHVFVLLAGSSARLAGHPDADRLIEDASAVIDRHFWDETEGRLCDEFNRDWTPFSTYRGMNANMHGVEALLGAYEATENAIHLDRAGRILDFFVRTTAPAHGWRIPEHYTEDWRVDPDYRGDPIFRPAGTTPGHSLEFARLALQHWDLSGRPDDGTIERARHLTDRALDAGWAPDGGLVYTLADDGSVGIPTRFWWPVTEGIGALAALLKIDPRPRDETWYRRLWTFAASHFIDHARGGWFPELDAHGAPASAQFHGKPDLYHALQAELFPLSPAVSRLLATG